MKEGGGAEQGGSGIGSDKEVQQGEQRKQRKQGAHVHPPASPERFGGSSDMAEQRSNSDFSDQEENGQLANESRAHGGMTTVNRF